ncbi:MAG: response regulator transcription factor [Erysipelotrichaceae bacterium]|nr:response regulator transcription factor [Erysipelotrichaceae bacterium]MDY5251356.1 response regulator transcription factor [Erysipelotrichaceae bacterium]
MAKLLIVDDEARIRDLINKYASYEGHQCAEAQDGDQAIELCRMHDYDLIIMDVMMKETTGFEAVKQIKAFKDIPVIMLTALNEEYDKIRGFDLGIDDYVVKPFSAKELMMRVNAILKRTQKNHQTKNYQYKSLKVDFSARIVTIDEKRIKLSLKEYDLLVYLINNRNIALTREQILSFVWGYNFYGDDRTLDTHIKLLRKNLGEYGNCIVTLRGVGYRFEEN